MQCPQAGASPTAEAGRGGWDVFRTGVVEEEGVEPPVEGGGRAPYDSVTFPKSLSRVVLFTFRGVLLKSVLA